VRILEVIPDAVPVGEELLDALDEALASGIVLDAGANSYTFAHALIRQTLYSELSSARRTRLHRRVGEALESLPDADRHLDALAHHFAEAAIDGQATKAASYALSAGHEAMARLAFEEGVSALERGLNALEFGAADDVALRADLLLAVSDARHASGVFGSREAALEAADLARGLGSAGRLGQAALLLARQAALGIADPEASVVCEEALAALPDAEPALRSRVMAELARYRAYGEGQRAAAAALIGEAIDLARASGDRTALAAVMGSATFASFGSERPDEIIRLGDELVALCEEIGDARGQYDGLVARAVAKRQRGDMHAFHADVALIEQLAGESRSWFGLAVAASLKASQALIEGRFADVEALVEEMATLGGNDPNIFNLRLGALLLLTLATGELQHQIAATEFAVAARPGIVAIRAGLARLYAQEGRDEASRRTMDELLDRDLAALPRDPTWSSALALLAEAAAYLGDRKAAELLYPKLAPYRGQLLLVGRTGSFGSVDRCLGILATSLEKWDTAESLFLDAGAFEERLGAIPHLARTRVWHARMLIARAGDTQRAQDLLAAALEVADELGLATLAAEAQELLASLTPK
jgi:tetratricopeptide (TPR) repeat protein